MMNSVRQPAWYITIAFLLLFAPVAFSQGHGLEYYVDHAMDNSPLLKDYHNQVASNRIDSERIRAGYRPQVTGNGNSSFAPIIHGFGYDGVITNQGNVTALVNANLALASKKNLHAQFQTLGLQSEGIENTARIGEQDLKRSVTTQYVTTYGDMQQLKFTREIYKLMQVEDTLLKQLTEKNVYRQTDYLTFLVTMQQQDLSMRQLTIQFRNDLATLNYLSGIEDTAASDLSEPAIRLNPLPQPENSVFFRQYSIDSMQLVNQRTILDLGYRPKVHLFADAGYNTSFQSLNPYKNFGTSFGAAVTVPIYDGRQRKLQYRKLDISERTRQGYKEFFTHQYNQQIAQLANQLRLTEELIDQINHQIKYSEGLIQVNTKLLTTGDVRIADLIIALNNYLTAKNLLTQNSINRWQIISQINYWNR